MSLVVKFLFKKKNVETEMFELKQFNLTLTCLTTYVHYFFSAFSMGL